MIFIDKILIFSLSLKCFKTFLLGKKVRKGKRYIQLRAHVLRGAVSRVGPLVLALREGAHFKRKGGGIGKRYYTGIPLCSPGDSTEVPLFSIRVIVPEFLCFQSRCTRRWTRVCYGRRNGRGSTPQYMEEAAGAGPGGRRGRPGRGGRERRRRTPGSTCRVSDAGKRCLGGAGLSGDAHWLPVTLQGEQEEERLRLNRPVSTSFFQNVEQPFWHGVVPVLINLSMNRTTLRFRWLFFLGNELLQNVSPVHPVFSVLWLGSFTCAGVLSGDGACPVNGYSSHSGTEICPRFCAVLTFLQRTTVAIDGSGNFDQERTPYLYPSLCMWTNHKTNGSHANRCRGLE